MSTATKPEIDTAMAKIVNDFLKWQLPSSVASDPCVCRNDGPHVKHRTGTNLLSCPEAVALVQEVIRPVFEQAIPEDAFDAQWYPTTDMLPLDGEVVLAAWDRGEDQVTMRTARHGQQGWVMCGGVKPKSDPTHFRELPKLRR